MSEAAASIARADAALRGGDLAGAEQALAVALAEASPAADALLLMAEVRRLQGRLDDAENLARRATDADPRSGRAPGRLGAIRQVLNRFEAARAAYEEALRREPDLDAVRLNYLRCLFAMGAFADVEAEAQVLLTRKPSAAVFTLLSDALRAQNRAEEAIVAADRALEFAPGDRSAALAKARALEGGGQTADSLAIYAKLSTAGFGAVEEVLGFARALNADGDATGAERALAGGLQRWPDNEQLLNALCKVRWISAGSETFAEPMLSALARSPDNLSMRLSAANLLYRGQRLDQAEAILRDGLARFPGNAALSSSLAVLVDTAGRPLEALEFYEAAQRAAPDDAIVSANRAAVLTRLGRADEALAVLRPLRAMRPDAQDLIAREALALRVKGDPGYQSIYDYERYVRPYFIEPPAGFASLAAFNAELGERLKALHGAAAHPLDQSLRNGTQTRTDLARSSDPLVRAFIAALEAPIRDYIHKLPNDAADPMGRRKTNGHRIWGCWSVRLRPAGFHVNHVHPEGWISSSYYVEVPARHEGDDPYAGWIKFGEPDLPVPGCDPELFVEPSAGKLVLFPSYMWHGTVPFRRGERLTAPFDVVPS